MRRILESGCERSMRGIPEKGLQFLMRGNCSIDGFEKTPMAVRVLEEHVEF